MKQIEAVLELISDDSASKFVFVDDGEVGSLIEQYKNSEEMALLWSSIRRFTLFNQCDYEFNLYELSEFVAYQDAYFGGVICDDKRIVSDTWVIIGEYTADDVFCIEPETGKCFACSFGFPPVGFSHSLSEGLEKIFLAGGDSIAWLEESFVPAFEICK